MAEALSNQTLRTELEKRLQTGRCVYCRTPATPGRPLTREHVIPRARGGGRHDLGIIVPACVECNRRRGHQEIVCFLLARPQRIVAFLDHLDSLTLEEMRSIDLRVFAELYAALWVMGEAIERGEDWRQAIREEGNRRRIHRRRYAARRIVAAVAERLERVREREAWQEGPSCLVPTGDDLTPDANGDGEAVPAIVTSLVDTLSRLWSVSADRVHRELTRECQRAAREPVPDDDEEAIAAGRLDRSQRRKKRERVDRR